MLNICRCTSLNFNSDTTNRFNDNIFGMAIENC
jgi:hypothetical protein